MTSWIKNLIFLNYKLIFASINYFFGMILATSKCCDYCTNFILNQTVHIKYLNTYYLLQIVLNKRSLWLFQDSKWYFLFVLVLINLLSKIFSFEVNQEHYNSYLECLFHFGETDKPMALFEEIRGQILVPEVRTYHFLIYVGPWKKNWNPYRRSIREDHWWTFKIKDLNNILTLMII